MGYQKFLGKLRKRIEDIVRGYRFLRRQIYQHLALSKRAKIYQPTVLICAHSLMKNGGIEKRVNQYVGVWKKRQYRILFGAREGNGPIDIFFSSYRWYNMLLLYRLKQVCNVQMVEFNVGGEEQPFFYFTLLHRLDIHIGVILHASFDSWKYDYLKEADYVICSHAAHGKRVACLAKYPVLPNAVKKKEPSWQFCGQKKALLVSRLGEDKRPSIEAFITLCLKWHMPFQIAGDFSEQGGRKLKFDLQRQFNLDEKIFLGYINTEEFLQKYWKRFLFVGGIGQVILEAGQLGYPCLLTSLLGEQQSFWVTQNNIGDVINYNCSPHSVAESALLKQNQNLEDCFQDISSGKTSLYSISSFINENCSLEANIVKYDLITRSKRKTVGS